MSGWRVRDVIESLINRTSASGSQVKTLSGELTEAKHALTISDVKSVSRYVKRSIVYYRAIVEKVSVTLPLVGTRDVAVMTTTTRRTFVIVIVVTLITIRMNSIAFVLLQRLNVVGRILVSILIVVVAKGTAMMVIVMKTIFVAVPPGVALVVQRIGSYVRIVDIVDSLNV